MFTGYGRVGGTKTSAEELTRIFDFMQQSGVLVPDRLLTGYIPNAESLGSVHELVQKLRISNPNLVYLLDREQSLSRHPTLEISQLFSRDGRRWKALRIGRLYICIPSNAPIGKYHHPELVRGRVCLLILSSIK